MSAAAFGRRCRGAALGLLADRVVGEPISRRHPVAAFGQFMAHAETRLYEPTRRAGTEYTALAVILAALAGGIVRSTALATAIAASGRMLRSTALEIAGQLERGDVDGARRALPALVGRDPSALDARGIAGAVVESVAENTVDAVAAPAVWSAAAGAPGVFVHRAANTLDAMVGHRSERYEQFGWASARLDDAMAWIPARVTAAVVAALRPRRAAAVLAAVRHHAPAHPSPNAGVAEAAFAAALGVELGGVVQYPDHVESRPALGSGPRPTAGDISRACRLSDHVEVAFLGGLGALGIVLGAVTETSR